MRSANTMSARHRHPHLAGYQAAKTTQTLAVTEPSVNPDTGFPIISLRVPIFHGVEFLGCASANITVDVLSRFSRQASGQRRKHHLRRRPQHRQDHSVSDKQKGVRIENGKIKVATLADIDHLEVREAHRQHTLKGADSFVFQSPTNGEDLIAAFANFPGGFGQPWQVITLTPIDDFVGTLKKTNRLMMVVIIGLTMVELFFIFSPLAGCRGRSKTCPATASDPKPQFRCTRAATVEYPGDRETGIGRLAVAHIAEIVLLLRSARCGPPAHQVRHSLDPRRRAAVPHRVLFRSGEFFSHSPKRSRLTTCWSRYRPISRRSRPRSRRKAAPSISSSAMASWLSGMPRLNALTTFYVPAPRRCGRYAAWSASTMPGRRKDGRESHQDRASIAPTSLSAMSGLRTG